VNVAFGAASDMSEEAYDWLVSFLTDKYEVVLE